MSLNPFLFLVFFTFLGSKKTAQTLSLYRILQSVAQRVTNQRAR